MSALIEFESKFRRGQPDECWEWDAVETEKDTGSFAIQGLTDSRIWSMLVKYRMDFLSATIAIIHHVLILLIFMQERPRITSGIALREEDLLVISVEKLAMQGILGQRKAGLSGPAETGDAEFASRQNGS